MKSIPLFLAALVLGLAGVAAAADPVARTDAFVKKLQTVKPIPDDGSELSAADKKANGATFKALDGFLDFDTLVSDSVGGHKNKFKSNQLATFKQDFSELIRLVAYANSGAFFKSAEYKLKLKSKKGKKADVEMAAYLPDEDIDTVVVFHWADSRLVDVSIDGESLVKSYNAQFGRIINKGGADDLIKRAAKRLAKEKEEAIIPL